MSRREAGTARDFWRPPRLSGLKADAARVGHAVPHKPRRPHAVVLAEREAAIAALRDNRATS